MEIDDTKQSKKHRRHHAAAAGAAEGDKSDSMIKKKKKKQKLQHPAPPPQKDEEDKGRKNKKKKKHNEIHQEDTTNTGGDGQGDERKDKGKWKSKRVGLITDERFVSANSDPRFQSMPKRELKVPIDSRFDRIFDADFVGSSARVDKRGKPRRGKPVNPLLHYYLKQDDGKDKRDKLESEGMKGGSEEEVSDEEDMFDSVSEASDGSTDIDDEDGEDGQSSVNSDIVRYLMANHEDTPKIEEETHRLAVVNMDWEHIKAVDLYVVMNSCLPKVGQILSVAVYPSEFGLQQMELEAVQGPSRLVGDNGQNSEDDSEDENEKFRVYELNKLRYYYAVVVCDSSATANHIYKTLDGTEFLSTSNVFDLRFIPDSMEFKIPPRDNTTEAPTRYEEPDFETRALQHSKVKLTWDEDEPHRKKILRRKFNPDQLDEFNEYLASSGESDGDHGSNSGEDGAENGLPNGESGKRLGREKWLSLLQPGDDSDADHGEDKDMEVIFNTGLENIGKRILEKKDKESLTVWEAVLKKRSEKKKARKKRSKHSSEDDSSDFDVQKAPEEHDDFFSGDSSDSDATAGNKNTSKKSKARGKSSGKGVDQYPDINNNLEATKEELELLLADDQGDDHAPKGYNIKTKRKGRKGKETPVEDKLLNVDFKDDPRFSALSNSHLFVLDPTDPQYKRSAAYLRQQSRKQKTNSREDTPEEEAANPSQQAELKTVDVVQNKHDNMHQSLSSMEKDRHKFSSTVRSLKRNLGTLKKDRKNDSKGR